MPENISTFKAASPAAVSAPWQSGHVLSSNPIVFTGGAVPSQKEIFASNSSQAFCLRWNNYQYNLMSVFETYKMNELFVDVTLACEGSLIKAHKMVLSACSPYFQTIFADNPCEHPVVIMNDIRLVEMKAIVEFIYTGQVNIAQEDISQLLRVAETLKIRGLADVSDNQTNTEIPGMNAMTNEPKPKTTSTDETKQPGTALNCTPQPPLKPTTSLRTPKKEIQNLCKRKEEAEIVSPRSKRFKSSKVQDDQAATPIKQKKKKCDKIVGAEELIGQIKEETTQSSIEDDNKVRFK